MSFLCSTSMRGMLLLLARAYRECEMGRLVTYSDELLVLGIVAVLGEDAENGLLAVEGFANLVQALHETY